MNTQELNEILSDIINGIGWATDDYIINFPDRLTKEEQRYLAIELADKGLLVEEMLLETGEEGWLEDVPAIALVSVKRAKELFKV